MEPEPDDVELARRAREGHREALAELVERTRLRLFALAYAELRHYEDAQDAVAAALLQICRHVGELREPERVRAWMQRITRNEARLILRRRGAVPLSLDAGEPAEDLAFSAGEPASGRGDGVSLLRVDIERALRQLPRDEARALALFYLAHVPVREIAERTGRPEGTIKRWLHQGRQHLATQMEGYAPMTPTAKKAAAILSTELEPAVLQSLLDGMKAAGWEEVAAVGAVPVVEKSDSGAMELHLTEPLRGKQFIVLDDSIGGRSAFEVHTLLKAAVEAKGIVFGLLSASARESTVWAAWLAGFELFLIKPVDPAEFQEFSRRILAGPCGPAA